MRYWAIEAGFVFCFLLLFYYRLPLYWSWWTYCYYFLEAPGGLCGSWTYQQSVHRHCLSATIVWNVNFGCTIPLIKDSGAMIWACFFASMQCDCFYACTLLAPVISVQSVASEVWLIFFMHLSLTSAPSSLDNSTVWLLHWSCESVFSPFNKCVMCKISEPSFFSFLFLLLTLEY